jgi:diacylglycerol kinase (ATP)
VPQNAVAILNPAAGRRRGQELAQLALAELKRRMPDVEVCATSKPEDVEVQARSARDRPLVVAVGGDGTVRDVAAGLVGSAAELAIVPVGSGNDFAKTIGVPRDIPAACRIAAEGKATAVDAVRAEMSGPAGTRERHYVNVAGFGFDAMVVAEARRSRHLRGLALYVNAVFRAVRDYHCPQVRLKLGDREWRQGILLCAVANGRLYGGGMRIAPEAKPDDGLLDICVAAPMNRPEIMRALPRLVAGTHVTMKKVRMMRAPAMELELVNPAPVQLDGDVIDTSGYTTFRMSIVPGAVRVRV